MKNLTKIAMIGALASFAFSAAQAADMKKVAISTIVEVPALLDTKKGILEGLAEKGFVVGKNITLDYQNANGNMPTQQQIAKKFRRISIMVNQFTYYYPHYHTNGASHGRRNEKYPYRFHRSNRSN